MSQMSQKTVWDEPSVFVVMLILTLVVCGVSMRLSAGAPADIGSLGPQPQTLVWRSGQIGLFRSLDGQERLVRINVPHQPLEVGAAYQVKDSPILSKVGWLHSLWLDKAKNTSARI